MPSENEPAKEFLLAFFAILLVAMACSDMWSSLPHKIAADQLVVSGQAVAVKVFDNRTLDYQPSATEFVTVSVKDGKLGVTDKTLFPRWFMIETHREPTAAESTLWHKHFG